VDTIQFVGCTGNKFVMVDVQVLTMLVL